MSESAILTTTSKPALSSDTDTQTLPDRLLRAADVQRELGISRATAYRLMTDGTLPTYRFGGRRGKRAMVRVSATDLRTWMVAQRTVTPEPCELPAEFELTKQFMLLEKR